MCCAKSYRPLLVSSYFLITSDFPRVLFPSRLMYCLAFVVGWRFHGLFAFAQSVQGFSEDVSLRAKAYITASSVNCSHLIVQVSFFCISNWYTSDIRLICSLYESFFFSEVFGSSEKVVVFVFASLVIFGRSTGASLPINPLSYIPA
jgi:hypothetical protein